MGRLILKIAAKDGKGAIWHQLTLEPGKLVHVEFGVPPVLITGFDAYWEEDVTRPLPKPAEGRTEPKKISHPKETTAKQAMRAAAKVRG